MWAGIIAAPAAWAAEHLTGWLATERECDQATTHAPVSGWVAVVTIAAFVVAAGGLLSAIAAFRDIRDQAGQDSDPPPGRIWLMSIFGIVLSPLFLAMIVLSGAGVLILGHCHQG